MMAEIAKSDFIHKVIFVNPFISIRKISRNKNKSNGPWSPPAARVLPSKKTSKIWEYTLFHFLPFKNYCSMLAKLENQINLSIVRLLNHDMPFILFINSPRNPLQYLVDELLKKANLSIFDFSDDFVEYYSSEEVKGRAIFSRNVAKYAKSADIVLAVNDHIKIKYAHLNRNIHVIRNATNYFNFDRETYRKIDLLERMKNRGMPVVGYSGGISPSRIDFNILDFLFQQRPHWSYVFVGRAYSSCMERYRKYDNFYHLPPVDYQNLPDCIRYFDVAIVPFKVNEHTRGNDLLKFHDYLAMGKPIVSTDMGGAKDLRGLIRIAHGPSDFLEKVEQTLARDTFEDTLKRKRVALENSWQERIKELEELIKNSLRI